MIKTALKTALKNYLVIKKKMSFLKISDPTKRDQTVKEYLELKKNIRDNLLSERTGEQQLQTELTKFYRPITETQKLQPERLPKGLNLLERVSRNYHKLCNLSVKHREKHQRNTRKKWKKMKDWLVK